VLPSAGAARPKSKKEHLLMLNKETENLIMCRALREYGIEAQKNKTIEELAELIRALAGAKPPQGQGRKEHIAEEIADVEIMLEQMKIWRCMWNTVEGAREAKLRRLADKLGIEIIEI
jgi:NTP pyrophosphatase (non-canonical NTP hydrolase)